MKPTLYHNPRCSKSRQALALMEEKGIAVDVREYLKQPLSAAELNALIETLAIPAHDLLRKKEAEYKAAGLTLDASQEQIVAAMVEAPKLMERPVLVTDKGARIGRPTEALLEII